MRFQQVYEGDWLPVRMSGEERMCCDCCLIHRHRYKFDDKLGLMEQVQVDKKKTYAARRRAGVKIVKTK